MLKGVIGLLSLAFVAGSSLAYAQQASRPSQADLNALTDARIGIVKAALQLTPDQAKYWPPIEQAIRERAQIHDARIAAVTERLSQQREVDPSVERRCIKKRSAQQFGCRHQGPRGGDFHSHGVSGGRELPAPAVPRQSHEFELPGTVPFSRRAPDGALAGAEPRRRGVLNAPLARFSHVRFH